MKAYSVLNVKTREVGKKSMTKVLLQNNIIPGVIYLKNRDSLCVSIDAKQLSAVINDPSAMTRIYEVKNGDKSIFCILKEIQFNPALDLPRSFDLMEVASNDVVKVNVPLKVLNKDICPGVKNGGDIYMLVYNVELRCNVESIPYAIEIDVKDCDMGKKFFLSDIKLPDGCKMINDTILLRVAGKRVIKDEVKTEGVADGDATSATDATASATFATQGSAGATSSADKTATSSDKPAGK